MSTDSDEAVALASFFGLGTTVARNDLAMLAMATSSVETTTSETYRDRLAWRMLCTTKGIPKSGKVFLRGILSDPPRAGIMAMIFFALVFTI